MTNERPHRASLWLGDCSDLDCWAANTRRADLEEVCGLFDWQIVGAYEDQFQLMVEDARKGTFDVLVVWSLDRLTSATDWSMNRFTDALLDRHIRFYSSREPFLDTAGPFAGLLEPLMYWVALQERSHMRKAIGRKRPKANASLAQRVERVDTKRMIGQEERKMPGVILLRLAWDKQ